MEELFNEFIPYEQALELKELGFDESCFGSYSFNNRDNKYQVILEHPESQEESKSSFGILAPTFSQAFRWFRDKYGLHGYCTQPTENNNYWGHSLSYKAMCSSYEEAELILLKKLIEIAKTK